ncbi:MAG TPA: TIR domain-containing protein [Thermoanaerobaculia bacterium]|jgi:WD40 repeat protein|nr:TIR domain-containing protein [Thermoanaerobaculia bacterium]
MKRRRHDGFLSYSHAVDRKLAPMVQDALHRLAKPWHKRRAVDVFRDETNLSANPDLWRSIVRELVRSRYLLFLASPAAAASPWVRKELDFWCSSKDPNKLLILLTDGDFAWDATLQKIDWARTTSLPQVPALDQAIVREPFWVDLRPFRNLSPTDQKLQNEFLGKIAAVAAPLHGLDNKDEIFGEDIRQRRKALTLAWGGAALLSVLFVLSLVFAAGTQAGRLRSQYNLVSSYLTLGDTAVRDDRRAEAAYWYWRAYDEGPRGDPRSNLARRLVAGWSASWMRLRNPSAVTALALSPDGTTIAIGGADGSIHVRGVKDDVLRLRIDASKDPVRFLRFSRDGTLLAVVHLRGACSVHTMGNPSRVLMRIPGGVRKITFTNDDAFLVGIDSRGSVGRWSLRPPCAPCEALAGGDIYAKTELSDDAGYTSTISDQAIASVRDPASGETVGTFEHTELRNLDDQISLVRFDTARRRLATVGIANIRLWDIAKRAAIGEPIAHKGQFFDAVFHPLTGSFITAGHEGIRTWSPIGREESQWLTGEGTIQAVAVGAKAMVTAAGSESGLVEIRALAPKELTFRGGGYHQLAAMPSDDALWVSRGGKEIWRVFPNRGTSQLLFRTEHSILSLTVDARGRMAAIGTPDDVFVLNLVHPNLPPMKLNHEFSSIVRDLDFSRDGNHLTTITQLGTVRLWRLAGGRAAEVWESRVRNGNGWCVKFSPDGKSIAASREWELDILKVEDGSTGATLPVKTTVYGMAFSPDGSALLMGRFDDKAEVWDVRTMQKIGASLDHRETVTAVAFSSDGSLIATASVDGTARLWDAATHRPLTPPWPHAARVDAAVFGRGDNTVITQSGDGVLSVWDVPVPSIRDREHLRLSVEVRSGYRRDAERRQPLTYAEWASRQAMLGTKYGAAADVRSWRSVSPEALASEERAHQPNWWTRQWLRYLRWR